MKILTNNPMVLEKMECEVEYLNTDYLGIVKRARDYVHKGFVLLTHPLSGSVKPNETPYKSIALDSGCNLHYDSLRIIENSMDTVVKFKLDYKNTQCSEKILKDFQLIDLDLIKNAL